jgi:tetratricopeptide (TPR) repeat protein
MNRIARCFLPLLLPTLLGVLSACRSGDSEVIPGAESPLEPAAISFLGDSLYSDQPAGDAAERMEAELAEAVALHDTDPDAIDGFVWHGRRLAYLGRYAEAIEVYSQGLALHPNEPHLLRHRGHRFITLRRIDSAKADLVRAAAAVSGHPDEVEPDGQPNAAGIPTSTLQTNIYYHLGLAQYLGSEFAAAASSFQWCLDLATNDDMRVAAADWLYMSLRRSGRHEEAGEAISFVGEGMELLENESYYRRLRMYRGFIAPDSIEADFGGDDEALTRATLGYGVGNFHLANGDTARAVAIFERVLDTGFWPAFGFIAAEADLARMGWTPGE